VTGKKVRGSWGDAALRERKRIVSKSSKNPPPTGPGREGELGEHQERVQVGWNGAKGPHGEKKKKEGVGVTLGRKDAKQNRRIRNGQLTRKAGAKTVLTV